MNLWEIIMKKKDAKLYVNYVYKYFMFTNILMKQSRRITPKRNKFYQKVP